MLQPFADNLNLSIPFPNPDEIEKALAGSTRNIREIIARLWLTEGLPFAFNSCPAIYENLRGWLSSRLNVHPKEITLIGSARLGYSLAPSPDFGKPFNQASDLDLSIISGDLFGRLASAFSEFSNDYRNGSIAPRSEYERKLWDANLVFGARNIPRGFFDANKIPNFDRYRTVQQLNHSMWALHKKLEMTPNAPRVRKVSTRVYQDWHRFIERVSLNLRCIPGDQFMNRSDKLLC